MPKHNLFLKFLVVAILVLCINASKSYSGNSKSKSGNSGKVSPKSNGLSQQKNTKKTFDEIGDKMRNKACRKCNNCRIQNEATPDKCDKICQVCPDDSNHVMDPYKFAADHKQKLKQHCDTNEHIVEEISKMQKFDTGKLDIAKELICTELISTPAEWFLALEGKSSQRDILPGSLYGSYVGTPDPKKSLKNQVISEGLPLYTMGWDGLKYLLELNDFAQNDATIPPELKESYWFVGGQHSVGFNTVLMNQAFTVFSPPKDLPILALTVSGLQIFSNEYLFKSYGRDALVDYAANEIGITDQISNYSVFKQFTNLSGCYNESTSSLDDAVKFQDFFFQLPNNAFPDDAQCDPKFVKALNESSKFSNFFLEGFKQFYQKVEDGTLPNDDPATYRAFTDGHVGQTPLNTGVGYTWNLVWDFYPPPEGSTSFTFGNGELGNEPIPRANGLPNHPIQFGGVTCNGYGATMMFQEYLFPNTKTVYKNEFLTFGDLSSYQIFTKDLVTKEVQDTLGACTDCTCQNTMVIT